MSSNIEKVVPEVEIVLDRPRKYCVDMNMIRNLWKKTGIDLFQGKPEDMARLASPDPEVMQALLWSGLTSDDPDLSYEQAGALITVGNVGQLIEVFDKAFARASLPEEKKKAPAASRKKTPIG